MTHPWRLLMGINSPEDVENVNQESFSINGPKKALFYKILRLIHPIPDEWLDQCTGPGRVMTKIYREYLTHEKQTWRRENMIRAIPFLIILMDQDDNYREIADWWISQIIAHQDEFQPLPWSIYPHCWYADNRGRDVPTPDETKEYMMRYDIRKTIQ